MKPTLLLLLIAFAAPAQTLKPWRQTVEDRLHVYGHRNWIVVADSAYPLQSSPGIETIQSPENQIETLRHVFESLNKVLHLRAVPYTDAELKYVPEEDAVGISAYRQLLSGLFNSYLPQQKPVALPHEEIIRKLDEASKSFHILIVKTNMLLPYTSVFLELRAGYWNDDAERRLRAKIPPALPQK